MLKGVSFHLILMMVRMLIFLLILSACQRKSVPGHNGKDLDIDSTAQLLSKGEIPQNALNDVHNLLGIGYEKADKIIDSTTFLLYLDHRLKDSIRIQTSSHDTVYLIIGNPKNRSVALYSYLDHLGFRFYGPEDHWTHIPHLNNLPYIDTTVCSFFKVRRLLPSYSLSGRNIKTLQTSKELFSRWNDRLRMGSLIAIPAGHYGNSFNLKYKDEIIAHPEWRGVNKNGATRDWNPNLKLCYSHPEVIDLFKRDALLRLESLKKNSKPPYFINMEPPDADGACMCENCGSASEQVYSLVNDVAKYLYSIDTNAIVTLYGYNEHAQPPSFPIQKNVIVGIVPYAFQGVGSPEVMMEEWENSGARLYLRDYLAIPVWNFDKPTFNPLNNSLSKIERLKANEYLGYTFETTSSFMAVGLQFYLLSSTSWTNIDFDAEYRRFLENMFYGYVEDISIIFENLPFLNNKTYGGALHTIRGIKEKAYRNSDFEIIDRVSDLEFYIEYLYLLNKFQGRKSEENINILLDKIFSDPGIRLLDPYGLYRVMQREINITRPIQKTQNVPVQNIQFDSPIVSRRRSESQYKVINPEFYLDSVSDFPSLPLRNVKGVLYVGNNQNGKVKFRASLKPINSSASGVIIIRDEDNNHVMDVVLKPDDITRDIEIQLEPNKLYNLQFSTPGSELFLQGPNRPFAFNQKLPNRYIHQQVSFYFKVPNKQEQVILEVPLKSDLVIIKSDDEVLFKKNQEERYTITLENQENKILEAMMYREGIKLVNIPQMLSIHKEGVIYQTVGQ